ncbi:MAG: hypothetical protein IID46_08395 [Planctomycetes bacterium]|nr:hypothetical protein [Planctomycetota bacterium]
MSEPFLSREEYIEQAYFFRTYRERLEENMPSQDILADIHEEILATTKLPLAIEFLKGEIVLNGRISDGMARLPHYFTPFQTFVISQSEADKSKFDTRIALQVLQREAEYFSETPTPPGLFVYQFECIARNRLGYDAGMKAMAGDPFFSEDWSEWILKMRLNLGTTDFTDMIYYRSEHYVNERRRRTGNDDYQASYPILFSVQEGRIAKANRGKEPLYMFAALQRQIGFPKVPRPKPKSTGPVIHPVLEKRLQRLEQRLKLVEQEVKGDINLSEFYTKPPQFSDDDDNKKIS